MKYLISALELRDYKRIHTIAIEPSADATWIILGGDNATGKTGVLDAIEALLGGAEAILEDPVRHGAPRADLRGRLTRDGDGATLTVRRKISPDGTTTLEVRDDIGPVKGPQAMLDKLLGKLGKKFLDPLAWLRLKAPEQRLELLKLIDTDGKIAELDVARERLFTRRTEVGRDLKRAQGAVDSAPQVDPGESINVALLQTEIERIYQDVSDIQVKRSRFDELDRARAKQVAAVAAAQETLARAQLALDDAQTALADATLLAEAARETLPDETLLAQAIQRRGEIQAQLRTATEHNQAVAMRQADRARRIALVNERDKHSAEHDTLDARIGEIDVAKKARLLAAKLPVDGLDVTATGVTYRGAPLSSASGAERLMVAIGMAAAAQPMLRDVWIRDAAVLDDKSMQLVFEFAQTNGIRPWLERVGTRDPGVIEIRDGGVAGAELPQ